MKFILLKRAVLWPLRRWFPPMHPHSGHLAGHARDRWFPPEDRSVDPPPEHPYQTVEVPAPPGQSGVDICGRTFNWPAGQHEIQVTCMLPPRHVGYCRSIDGKGPRNADEFESPRTMQPPDAQPCRHCGHLAARHAESDCLGPPDVSQEEYEPCDCIGYEPVEEAGS